MSWMRRELIRDLRRNVLNRAVCDLAADEMEDMMDEIDNAQADRAALQRAITALIQISEPRVGGGQWAAKIAQEALDTMTCAGEAEREDI